MSHRGTCGAPGAAAGAAGAARARARRAARVAMGLVLAAAVAGAVLLAEAPSASEAVVVSPLRAPLALKECEGISKEDDKCAFVREKCPLDSLIDYLDLHYCANRDTPALSLIFIVFWLIVIFYLLGSTTETYFCPTLTVLSIKLNMSPAVAGVTLLALGNDAPDVFSIVAAVNDDALSLAFGEVVGAGCFVILVVLGSVVLVADVSVARSVFLRDASFYGIGVLLVLVFFLTPDFVIWEAVAMLIYYIIYVVVVFVAQMRTQRADQTTQAQIVNETAAAVASAGGLVVDAPNQSIYSDRTPLLAAAAADADAAKDGAAADHPRPRLLRRLSDSDLRHDDVRTAFFPKIGVVKQDARTGRVEATQVGPKKRRGTLLSAPPVPRGERVHSLVERQPSGIFFVRESYEDGSGEVIPTAETSTMTKRYLNTGEGGSLLFLWDDMVDLIGWDEMTTGEKAFFALEAPFLLARNVTIPRLPEGEWNRYTGILCPIFSPLFILWAAGLIETELGSEYFPLWVPVLVLGVVSGGMMERRTRFVGHRPPKGMLLNVFLVLAFLGSMAWIYVVASELVSLLQAVGVMLGLSQYILGVTILAWGNSVPDLVADIVVARQGFADMSCGHAFGGPIFNLIFGLGTAFLIKAIQLYPDAIDLEDINPDAFFVVIAVMVSVVAIIAIFIAFSFRPPRRVGLYLIAAYVCVTIVNVLFEADLFHLPDWHIADDRVR